jgi:hypothetical protein
MIAFFQAYRHFVDGFGNRHGGRGSTRPLPTAAGRFPRLPTRLRPIAVLGEEDEHTRATSRSLDSAKIGARVFLFLALDALVARGGGGVSAHDAWSNGGAVPALRESHMFARRRPRGRPTSTPCRNGPKSLQAFSKNFQIFACNLQIFTSFSLAVSWDFKGLQAKKRNKKSSRNFSRSAPAETPFAPGDPGAGARGGLKVRHGGKPSMTSDYPKTFAAQYPVSGESTLGAETPGGGAFRPNRNLPP